MNKIITTLVSVLLFQLSFGEIPTIKSQLESLNKCWKYVVFEDQALNERVIISDDEVKFIQFHLSYVEQKLREKNINHLNEEQKQKRIDALGMLHGYMWKGDFPKNLFHVNRTPYFIDHLGTACAVGYLIINSGHKELAKKISLENNYDYIYKLDLKYPQLQKWADEHGFTIDELAWIQPGYINCDTSCTQVAVINATGGIPPYSYFWLQTGDSSQLAVNLCPGQYYNCIVTDALGDTIPSDSCLIVYQASLIIGNSILVPGAYPVYLDAVTTADDGSCNGTATALADGDFPPYTYNWLGTGQYGQTAAGLCEGNYVLYVLNSMGCSKTKTVTINSITTIEEINQFSFSIYPNPGNEYLIISNLSVDLASIKIEIFNISGEKFYSEEIDSKNKNELNISISHLPAGIYNMKITSEDGVILKKFIKM